jgi:hypothetical protein
MINVEQKAKNILATLYELQPQINIRGLEPEAEKLTAMKGDLQELVAELAKDNKRLARVVGSLREDAVSSFLELKQLAIAMVSSSMLDADMHKASLVAELFIERSRDYLNGKAQFKAIHGGE